MEIKTIETAGFSASLISMRLPYNSKSDTLFGYNGILEIGEKDLKLAQSLIKKGGPHAKFSRGMVVFVSITAPIYFFSELETYRMGHERLCSESTMNNEGKGLSGDELSKVKSEIPMGRNLTKIDMFSYQCLRQIYFQRMNHRLPEWHVFIDWMHSLPYADEFIFVENYQKSHNHDGA